MNKMSQILTLSALSIAMLSFVGCNEEVEGTPLVPDIVGLEIINAPAKTYALENYLLKINANYTNNTSVEVTEFISWSVDKVQVGLMSTSPSNQYLANALSGDAKIGFKYKNIANNVVIENVGFKDLNISLSETNLTINSSYQFDVNASYLDGLVANPNTLIPKLLWESNDSSVATVDANGLMNTKAQGSVKITAHTFKDYTIEKNGVDDINSSKELLIREDNSSV